MAIDEDYEIGEECYEQLHLEDFSAAPSWLPGRR